MESKITEHYAVYNGDCVEVAASLPDESIGLSVFSPPFPSMYAYTDSERDMGNAGDTTQMMDHFEYLIPELLRITMPGRSCAIHLTQEPVFQFQEGYSGLRDFRGEMIRRMVTNGWIFRSERMIEKCPQLKAARTKDAGLAMKTAATDSARLTGTMPDYLIQFCKKGDNPEPIKALIDHDKNTLKNESGWITKQEWIWWANAIWWNSKRTSETMIREVAGVLGIDATKMQEAARMIWGDGISETDVLQNYTEGKDAKDEKHLCPLQLGVIERCVKLWSAPGDTVFSPFTGIGSEGYQSILLGRNFVGSELKPSYYNVAIRNLDYAVNKLRQGDGLLPGIESTTQEQTT